MNCELCGKEAVEVRVLGEPPGTGGAREPGSQVKIMKCNCGEGILCARCDSWMDEDEEGVYECSRCGNEYEP